MENIVFKQQFSSRVMFVGIALFFLAFLVAPLMILFVYSLTTDGGLSIANYAILTEDLSILQSVWNSIKISFVTATITTFLAFVLAYSIHFTQMNSRVRLLVSVGILVPMMLPTITYGFAIIYSFGNLGLITKLIGFQFFDIYGFQGLLLGYVIYTLPIAFLLINNSFYYVDKKYLLVSKLMGDKPWHSFNNTVLRPLLGTIGGAFILSFVLNFTDFGIPASVGGNYQVIATYLYQVMLGSIPDFNKGAVIAMMMLLPAVFGVLLLGWLERFDFHYDNISRTEILPNKLRDTVFSVASLIIVIGMLSIFVVMFIAPFVQNYPYNMTFTLENLTRTLYSSAIMNIYNNSVMVAAYSAIIGTLVAYVAALVNTRSNMEKKFTRTIDWVAMVTNTVPGMVIGLSYLFLFNNSDLKGTFTIIIISNIVHFFTAPYLMAKNSLKKMNPSWEITAELLGDTWLKTVWRVIIPNSIATIIEMVTYLFINSMITISAIIFLVSARTGLMTSKIKELQYFTDFNQVFILSLLIFLTNILVKLSSYYLVRWLATK